ncbi:hypothetical protein DAPPUDRAFT_238566 [Daphnia pulex]|uniref:PPM-type phosphatase domain-containing protein n=1 Tax=Daphnia pulex TaxID=6669 RepID=E9G823_DAPPU|nr:hypothetical protein DAPPUDRAFT_238566 [Daphnia pulex]|eukprot:EFX84341.1 hypothetical protein DAPPUDRAFT_238566 [Daphnia pulex]
MSVYPTLQMFRLNCHSYETALKASNSALLRREIEDSALWVLLSDGLLDGLRRERGLTPT